MLAQARRAARRAFTLVEILIVVVILGILAGIVVPQFTSAATQARAGTLAEQLQSLNGQIAIYYARNGNAYPDFTAEGWGALGDTTSLIGGGYMGKAPKNPAWTDSATASTVSVVNGAARGSATTAWVWNTDQGQLFASYFIEDTQQVTTNPLD